MSANDSQNFQNFQKYLDIAEILRLQSKNEKNENSDPQEHLCYKEADKLNLLYIGITNDSCSFQNNVEFEKAKLQQPQDNAEDNSDEVTKPVTKHDQTESLSTIRIWYFGVFEKFGHYPNNATLAAAWCELTGQSLTENALRFLREKIHSS